MSAPPVSYVEFATQSNFSFLRGASRPEELVVAAYMLGHAAMGLADRNTVAGVVRAWSQSKQILPEEKGAASSLPYHPGCRLVFADGTPDVLAYPRDRKGWGNLCRLLTQANFRDESPKGDPKVYLADLLEWGGHMSLAVIPALSTEVTKERDLLRQLREHFGRHAVWLAVTPLYNGNDRFRIEQAAAMASEAGLRLMAINDVLFHAAERRPLQDVLTAIRLNTPVARAGYALQANGERHLKPPAEMARLFKRYPGALAETIRFAETLKFSLSELEYNYPDEPTESGLAPQQELERLAWEGATHRYPECVPERVKEFIRKELDIIATLNYARYFLTVHDIVKFARSRGILCQGRGSAANSVVCYCIGITEVGPDIIDCLFERFISEKRGEPPDIDVDFEHERRDEVMAYIYEKYSEKHTALAASVVTYRGRSAMREVAKAMGLSDDVQSALSGSIWGWSSSEVGVKEAKAGGLAESDPMTVRVMQRANEIMGFPRHLSQHVGGFVITRDRLDEMVPIVKTAMDERKMVEWDKDDLDAVKMLKVDVLALGMLTCLKRAFVLLDEHYGLNLTLDSMKKEDERVYDMICRADTLGVFQIESRAQMSMLPRLKPREFYDLVIEVAIVRPGPIQGDMVHPYLRRREKKEKPDYVMPELETILGKTLGVPLFQEQAMKIAIVAGGFSPSEADELRRAMATFKRLGTIKDYKKRMISGMTAKGYPEEFALRVFKQIEGFGDYGFPESHAASFALLVYASCWFKTFYPDVFCAAILNSQPMGFYAPAQLVRDAADHGAEVRPVDINHSDWDCTLEEAPFDPAKVAHRHREMRSVILTRHAVRLGFRQIKGLSEAEMTTFVQQRGGGYESVRDVWLRSCLHVDAIRKLAEADAFRSIGLDRRAALWAVRALDGRSAAERLPLFDRPEVRLPDNEPETTLPAMPLGEHVIHDYRLLRLSLKAHPVSFLRAGLERDGVTPNAMLPDIRGGRRISIAGLVLVRQRPGKGNAIFLTLEDENSIANVIIWPRVFDRYRPVILGGRLVRVTGKLQSESGVIHIVAERIEDLSHRLEALSEAAQTVDFRSPPDEIKRAIDHDSRVRPNRRGVDREALREPAGHIGGEPAANVKKLMPKGRNFH
ncbi:error-prone DNA polymerase [Neoaquamicrobium sediminum]|uniref:error-prone DNA polymerase n=2 Tax=Pseudomonadota TaxID=1224 RepID=UPI003606A09F